MHRVRSRRRSGPAAATRRRTPCREPTRRGRGNPGLSTSPTPPWEQGTAQGPGALMQLRGPGRATSGVRRQLFFAGTAVGFAGLADRARVTRAEVAFAGEALRAGAVFLAGVPLVAVTGLAPDLGASTAFSAVALVFLAASSTLVSAFSATL